MQGVRRAGEEVDAVTFGHATDRHFGHFHKKVELNARETQVFLRTLFDIILKERRLLFNVIGGGGS